MSEFLENAKELDKLKCIPEPGTKDFKQALKMFSDNTFIRYFFERNDYSELSSGWFPLLYENKVFDDLESDDDETRLVRWNKAKYLCKVTVAYPDEVLELIMRLKPENDRILAVFFDILCELDHRYIEKGYDVIKRTFSKEKRLASEWIWYGEKSAEMSLKVIGANPDLAFKINALLLEIWKDKTNEFGREDGWFRPYEYNDLLFKYYCKVWGKCPKEATIQLLEALENYILSACKEGQTHDPSYYFYIRGEDLCNLSDSYGDDYIVPLIKAIFQAVKTVIEKEADKLDDVLKFLQAKDYDIFRRLEMYFLRIIEGDAYRDRINELIGDRNNFESISCKYEYNYLLRDKYELIKDDDSVKEYKKWIKEPQVNEDDKESLKQWYKETGQEYTKDIPSQYDARYRAQKLFIVREKFQDLYDQNKAIAKAGDDELAPESRMPQTRFVPGDEGTPLEKEKMLKMSVDDVLKHVSDQNNYPDDKKGWRPNRPAEALGYVFQQVVKERVAEYLAADIEKVIEIPAEFLSRYFNGVWNSLSENEGKIDWQALLNISQKTIEKYKTEAEGGGVLRPLLSMLTGELRARKGESKYSESHLKDVFGICESLVDFDEHRDRQHDDKDPVQIRCNSVPGMAFEGCFSAVVRYENYDELQERLRAVFAKILGEVKTPETLCTFGADFNRIFWRDPEWVEGNIGRVLSEENFINIWSTYLKWDRPAKISFSFLADKGYYSKAIDMFATKDTELGKELAKHMVIAYFNNWLEGGRDIFDEFLEKATDKCRARAASFFTTGFKDIIQMEDEKGKEKKRIATIARIKTYWEGRLAVIEKKPEDYEEEAKAFVGWVKESPLSTKETLELLRRTLVNGKGRAKRDWDIGSIIEVICEISKDHEKMALECINKLLLGLGEEMYFEECIDSLEKVFSVIEKDIDDTDVITEAMAVADTFGKLHVYAFRDNYFNLKEKLKGLSGNIH